MNLTQLGRKLPSTLIAGLILSILLLPSPAGEKDAPSPSGDDRPPEIEVPASGIEIDQTGYIKALYMSYGSLLSLPLRDHVRGLLETTELNAVVIDVKCDRGYLAYPSGVGMVQELGIAAYTAMDEPTWTEFMQWFHDRGVYTIARIVTFKDDPLAVAHPELAVWDSGTGGIWRDDEALAWTDPFLEDVHEYNVALAVEAAQMGFDEVQFDYVRFPSDGSVSRAGFALENTLENRVAAITSFLEKAKHALEPHGVKLGADVFGYVAWMDDDLGIGQNIEALARHLDVLSPMLYPSSFAMGLPGSDPAYRDAIAYPYEIVYWPTRRAVERAKAVNPEIEIRPWIQDFQDYAFDGRIYTPAEIREQMDGAREAGARGWMLWDPAMEFTAAALVSAQPRYVPNPQGGVLVLAYHSIGEPEDAWQRTPANLRADLDRLLAGGYYPINLRDLIEGQLRMVPAGKRPVVLTFDGSSITQFRVGPGGTIDPDSAAGILRAFHDSHPADWPLRATFFVSHDPEQPEAAVFGQPELARLKLVTLVDWGMEVGSRVPGRGDLDQVGAEEMRRELTLSQAQLREWLPGYGVVSLSVSDIKIPEVESLLASGEYDGITYSYQAAVRAGGGLAPSPRSPYFQPYHIPRVPASEAELDHWLSFADQSGVHYVSAGE